MSNEGSIIATHEIRLPEQFQGVFNDEECNVGEYSGSTSERAAVVARENNARSWVITVSTEELEDDFIVGIRRQFPNIENENEFHVMYRHFTAWLYHETEEFVETFVADNRALHHTSFWVNNVGYHGMVHARFDWKMIYLSTTVEGMREPDH